MRAVIRELFETVILALLSGVFLVAMGLLRLGWVANLLSHSVISGFITASGLLIAATLTLPWYILAEIKSPGFLHYFLLGEHFQRFVVPGWQGDLYGSGHQQPKGLIWLYASATFLPWSLFFLALLPRAASCVNEMTGSDRDWHSYLALWVVAPLILFTPAANILPAYALPGLPAAAVLLISLWAQVRGQQAQYLLEL